MLSGADGQNRTDDLSLTKGLLYQLSYIGKNYFQIKATNITTTSHKNNQLAV